MPATKLLSITGEVVAMIFTWEKGKSRLDGDILVTAERMDWSDQQARWGYQMRRAEPIEFDGYGKHYYAVGVADCHDPPLCVVRADHEGDAEEAFLSEKAWADWDQADIDTLVAEEGEEKAYERLTPTGRNTWAETEAIFAHEVFPFRAEFV